METSAARRAAPQGLELRRHRFPVLRAAFGIAGGGIVLRRLFTQASTIELVGALVAALAAGPRIRDFGNHRGIIGLMMMSSSAFDTIADLYDGSIPAHVAAHYLERRLTFIQSTFSPPARILDVGCGTGTLARRLQKAGYRVVGVDDSAGMLRLAAAKEVQVVKAQAQHLPFPDDSFDGAVSVAVLHHLKTAEAVRAAIHEIVRILRPGGAAVIWDHNALNPYWPILMRRVLQDDGTERLVPLKEILKVLTGCPGVAATHHRSGFIPDFAPVGMLRGLQRLERVLERLPVTSWLAAHNVVVARKD